MKTNFNKGLKWIYVFDNKEPKDYETSILSQLFRNKEEKKINYHDVVTRKQFVQSAYASDLGFY